MRKMFCFHYHFLNYTWCWTSFPVTCITFSVNSFFISNVNFFSLLLLICKTSFCLYMTVLQLFFYQMLQISVFYPFIFVLISSETFFPAEILNFCTVKAINLLLSDLCVCFLLKRPSHSKITKKILHIFPCITFVALMSYFLKLEMCLIVNVGKWSPA